MFLTAVKAIFFGFKGGLSAHDFILILLSKQKLQHFFSLIIMLCECFFVPLHTQKENSKSSNSK